MAIGLCRRLDQRWTEGGQSFPLSGVAIEDGGGDEAPKIARAFADLGYDVALLGDSDKAFNPDRAVLEGAGGNRDPLGRGRGAGTADRP